MRAVKVETIRVKVEEEDHSPLGSSQHYDDEISDDITPPPQRGDGPRHTVSRIDSSRLPYDAATRYRPQLMVASPSTTTPHKPGPITPPRLSSSVESSPQQSSILAWKKRSFHARPSSSLSSKSGSVSPTSSVKSVKYHLGDVEPENLTKVEKKRRDNTLAARKARAKKLDHVHALEAEVEDLRGQLDDRDRALLEKREEVEALKLLLMKDNKNLPLKEDN